MLVSSSRVVGFGGGAVDEVNVLKAPDMPKWMRTTS